VLPPEREPIHDYDAALHDAAKAYRVSTMRIAFYGHRMRMTEGWTVLGLEPGPRGEEVYRESLGIPRSSWYRAVRIGQAFHQLSLPELERIPIGNAEILLAVNPQIFNDHNWVHEARTLKGEHLAALVASRNKAIGDSREPLASMIFRVPLLARKAIETMLTKFQKQHELSSRSQAFELLIADRHDQRNLMAAVAQAKKLVGAAVQNLNRKHGVRHTDEFEWLRLATEVLDEAYEKEVQATRQRREKGVQNPT
jgi:hypothetical protein